MGGASAHGSSFFLKNKKFFFSFCLQSFRSGGRSSFAGVGGGGSSSQGYDPTQSNLTDIVDYKDDLQALRDKNVEIVCMNTPRSFFFFFFDTNTHTPARTTTWKSSQTVFQSSSALPSTWEM